MSEQIRALADQLGAQVIAKLPEVGHGALGAAHYAAFYRQRMAALRRKDGRLDADSARPVLAVPINTDTSEALHQLANEWSTTEQPVGAIDVATLLLEVLAPALTDSNLRQREEELAELRRKRSLLLQMLKSRQAAQGAEAGPGQSDGE